MTTPDPYRPPVPQPPAARKLKPLHVAALSLLALAVLCCGGVGVVGAVIEDDESGAEGAVSVEQTVVPRLAAPVKSASPSPSQSTRPATSPTEITATPAPRKTMVAPTPRKTTATPAPRKTTTRPKPKPTTKKPTAKPKPRATTKAPARTVTPGAFCAPEGAAGVSKKGKAYRCTKKAGEKQARWRAV